MSAIRRTSDLLAAGYSGRELARLVKAGDLEHIRRGAYGGPAEPSSPTGAHRRLVEATVPLIADDAVVSHQSAAVLHGLPLLKSPPPRAQFTRAGIPGGKSRRSVHLHATPLDSSEVVEVDGFRVTSLARTVVDLARSLTFEQAVVTGDAALRVGLAAEQLAQSLALARRRPGTGQARRVVGFLDARSESPGESFSRVVLWQQGIPAPQPQYQVRDQFGRLAGRADFGWEQQRTLGEFDGKVKYDELRRPGETAGDVVWREKRREDALRELGWLVIRWVWADLYQPADLAARLRRILASRRPSPL